MVTPIIISLAPTDDADLSLLPPKRASIGAAGFDLCANLSNELILNPLARLLVPTGIKIELPEGIEAQIRPRSGLAINSGITVVNAPGTIDWDYRGEIKVPLINLSDTAFTIEHGMRIAQMVFASVVVPNLEIEHNLSETVRGEQGFGSSGVKDPT